MRIYFDNNLINRLSEGGQARRLRSALDARRDYVMASGFNILEVMADRDHERRTARLRAISSIATTFVTEPELYRQGLELRGEIIRCRPCWLSKLPDPEVQTWVLKMRREYLANWRKLADLTEFSESNPPNWNDELFQAFSDQLHPIKGEAQKSQKALRDKIPAKNRASAQKDYSRIRWDIPGVDLRTLTAGIAEREMRWRFVAYGEWEGIILTRTPGSRDLRMFPNPAFRREPIDTQDYARFWFQDVDGDQIPTTRLIALVQMFQIDHPVRASNVLDLHHAIHLLDCDAVLTGDQSFAMVMKDVARYLPTVGKPIFVPNGENGVVYDPVESIIDTLDAV